MKKNIGILSCIIIILLILVACQTEEIKLVEEWKDDYPHIYESYLSNEDMQRTKYGGSEPYDYLEKYPNLKTFYDGYGFSKEYARARGHVYALDDVINTSRPKGGASCLACKTAFFIEVLDKDGVEVNKLNFDDFVKENPEMEGVSCYDCHRNEPGVINISRNHLIDAMEASSSMGEISLNNQSCAQCHVEYYLDPDTNGVVLPWKNGLNTDDMLTYYDDIDMVDWVHPGTGTDLLKAQHPEFETFYGSAHYNFGLSCTDCHMPQTSAGGESFKSHHWTSPLLSRQGLEESCMSCHNWEVEELIGNVENIQEGVTNKTNEVSDELLDFIIRLGKAVNDGDIEANDLFKLRQIHRHAQFKWDFVFVENSEGFHNSNKSHQNLDDARVLIEEGKRILEKYGM